MALIDVNREKNKENVLSESISKWSGKGSCEDGYQNVDYPGPILILSGNENLHRFDVHL